MNRHLLPGSLLVVLCLATLWGVWGQRSQLAGLRAEQQQILARLAAREQAAAASATGETSASRSGAAPPAVAASPELLRLRSEVTRLAERRRELAGVRAEHERLRAEVADRGTNGTAQYWSSPGFLRKSDARMVGYNTPDDTLQSLLCAVRNNDLTNALQAFTPEMANELTVRFAESGQSMEDFFSRVGGFFGMRIADRSTVVNDGSRLVWVELVPGMPGQLVNLSQTNGQWKIRSKP